MAAATIYLLAVLVSDQRQVAESLSRLAPSTWVLIVLLPIGNYVLRFCRWHWYLTSLGNSVSLRHDAQAYLAGFALTTTPGKVGEVVRSVFLQRIGVPYPDSLAAFVAERFTDLIAISLLSVFALSRLEGHGWYVALSFLLISLGLWLLLSGILEKRIASGSSQRSALQNLMLGTLGTLAGCRVLLSFRFLLGGLILGVIAWSLEGLAFWVVLDGLELRIDLILAIGVYAIGTLAGALSFIPGGLGPMEGVLGGFLVLLGNSVPDAVSATLVTRLATLWLAVGLGTVAMATLLIFGGRSDSQRVGGGN